jgi:hypothetical protein
MAKSHESPRGVQGRERFDVFFSYNRLDQPTVVQIAEALQSRGLKVWLDLWEIPPGEPWEPALERAINWATAAVVFVGDNGMGPWQIPEMYGALREAVRRKMRVIPVLLPGKYEEPKLPLFLGGHNWLDLRSGLTETGLGRLVWGITGEKPAVVAAPPQRRVAPIVEYRAVPKLPIESSGMRSLSADLERMRKKAVGFLTEKNRRSPPRARDIRANVFLPDSRSAKKFGLVRLFMPRALRKNMHRSAENRLRLRPGQGLSGTVFLEGRARIVHQREFQLTEKQKKSVHPALKWIVSMPLKHPRTNHTFAVLNIDGLNRQFNDEQLSPLITALEPDLRAFAAELAKQPRIKQRLL